MTSISRSNRRSSSFFNVWKFLCFVAVLGILAWTLLVSSDPYYYETSLTSATAAIQKTGGYLNSDQKESLGSNEWREAIRNSRRNDEVSEIDCNEIQAKWNNNGGQIVTTTTYPSFTMNIHHPDEDHWLSGAIARNGCWDCDVLKALMFALFEYDDTIFVDIGSKIGLFTLAAASVNRHVYSFEPQRSDWERTCISANLNGQDFLDNIHVYDVPLANPPKLGYHSIDSISSSSGFLPRDRPVVMKFNVEGMACDLLNGSMDYIQSIDNIRMIITKFQCGELQACGSTRAKIFELLAQKGLVPYKDTGFGFKALDPSQWMTWKTPLLTKSAAATTNKITSITTINVAPCEKFEIIWAKSKPYFSFSPNDNSKRYGPKGNVIGNGHNTTSQILQKRAGVGNLRLRKGNVTLPLIKKETTTTAGTTTENQGQGVLTFQNNDNQ